MSAEAFVTVGEGAGVYKGVIGDLYDKLIEIAKSRTTITYSEAAESIAGVRANSIWPLLDDLNRYEAKQGRPMISAVVVNGSSGIPGDGFFTIARLLGRNAPDPKSSKQARRAFWESELERLRRFWEDQESGSLYYCEDG